jgi:hypothetical protein
MSELPAPAEPGRMAFVEVVVVVEEASVLSELVVEVVVVEEASVLSELVLVVSSFTIDSGGSLVWTRSQSVVIF